MKTADVSTPYGYTIFCDDIRSEMGGKTSYIGIYPSELIVHGTFPARIPKFAFAISYFERPNESTDPVELRVYLPGDADDAATLVIPLPANDFRSIKLDYSENPDSLISVSGQFILAPMDLKCEGRIRVRAYRGDMEVKLGSLKISGAPPEPATAQSGAKAAADPN